MEDITNYKNGCLNVASLRLRYAIIKFMIHEKDKAV